MDPLSLFVGVVCGAGVGYLVARYRAECARADLDAQRIRAEERLVSAVAQGERAAASLQALSVEKEAIERELKLEIERRTAAEERTKRLPALEAVIAEREREARSLQGELSALLAARAELETRIVDERKAFEEKLALLDRAKVQLADAFKALSAEALQTNNQSFIDLAQQTFLKLQEGAKTDLAEREKAIDSLVKPIKETLEKFDGKVETLERARVAAYTSLGEQLKSLQLSEQELRLATSRLTNSLRAPNVRGRWGEMQLQRVVEMAGMVNYCDFVTQQSVSDDEQRRLRPDLVVRLPGDKRIVIDAKAPIVSYLEAMEGTDEVLRAVKLKDHARHIKSHLQQLSQKGYWAQFDFSPEFVVLFLPGESFFSAALEQEPGLIELGVEHQVIIATPTTLIALLRAVAYGWRQEMLAQNAREISKLGGELHDRLLTMGGHITSLGRGLEKAVECYNKSIASFESRVLVSARKLKELGATTSDELPLLDPVERTVTVITAAGTDDSLIT